MENTTDPPKAPTADRNKFRRNAGQVLGPLIIGLVVGAAGFWAYQTYLPQLIHAASTLALGLFIAVVLTFISILVFKRFLFRQLFGRSMSEAGDFLDHAQQLTDQLGTAMVDRVLPADNPTAREQVKNLWPKLTHWLLWSRFRNWWWNWLFSLFVAVGGLAGTLLLLRQNELITTQIHLTEASRRSALVFLMSNILDKVDAEIAQQRIQNPKDSLFQLSPSLIGQIAALSHSLKPYRYMENDVLIETPLSPERGQLLITLTQLPLDSTTFSKIYQKATFEQAALQGAVLNRANLKGADLRDADLTNAVLWKADLRGANLFLADLTSADLRGANLFLANLFLADLSQAILTSSDFSQAILTSADLSKAKLERTKIDLEQLKKTRSLYDCKNLDPKIKAELLKTHPQLFEDPFKE